MSREDNLIDLLFLIVSLFMGLQIGTKTLILEYTLTNYELIFGGKIFCLLLDFGVLRLLTCVSSSTDL